MHESYKIASEYNMDQFSEGIKLFEGESQHLQWLTPITMGYLYTLTGVWWHFALTIFAIGGARFSSDLAKRVRNDNSTYAELIQNGFEVSPVRGVFLIVLGAPCVLAIFYAPYLLYVEFSHTDIILVSLAAVYFGILIILVQIFTFPEM